MIPHGRALAFTAVRAVRFGRGIYSVWEELHGYRGRSVPSIAEQVAQVPTDPGCYLWKDASSQVIYVGKAKNLRAPHAPVRHLAGRPPGIPLMMQLVASFDYRGRQHRLNVLDETSSANTIPISTLITRTISPIPTSPSPRATSFPLSSTRARSTVQIRAISAPTRTAARLGRPSIRCARCAPSAARRVRSGSACAACWRKAPRMRTSSVLSARRRAAPVSITTWGAVRACARA